MNWKKLAFASAAALAATLGPAMAAYTEVWRTGGFSMPESVAFDPTGDAFYVSNVNSPDMLANGRGYVSKVGVDGTVIAEKFVDGLNAPKGIDIDVSGRRLFVAGVQQLTEVDIETGAITHVYDATGAGFLNDVIVAPDGRVFVSETMTGSIWALDNGVFSEWLRDPSIAGANGLTVVGGALLVAPLGDISQGFANMTPQGVKSVDLATKAITAWPGPPIGALDGIEPLANGTVLVTDNTGGRVVKVSPDGTATDVLKVNSGAADFEYVADKAMIVVPQFGDNAVVAYKE